ncbi:hypothetical protein Pelo_7255 [Pelomyxa schiedti]|nr:hypothetical protein Pelo_7255 [Pelomyxa schiedti]
MESRTQLMFEIKQTKEVSRLFNVLLSDMRKMHDSMSELTVLQKKIAQDMTLLSSQADDAWSMTHLASSRLTKCTQLQLALNSNREQSSIGIRITQAISLTKTIKKGDAKLSSTVEELEAAANKERKKGEISSKTLEQLEQAVKVAREYRVKQICELTRLRILMANCWMQMWGHWLEKQKVMHEASSSKLSASKSLIDELIEGLPDVTDAIEEAEKWTPNDSSKRKDPSSNPSSIPTQQPPHSASPTLAQSAPTITTTISRSNSESSIQSTTTPATIPPSDTPNTPQTSSPVTPSAGTTRPSSLSISQQRLSAH